MIRTQIYIPEDIHKELLRLAQIRSEPMAKLTREFIEDGLKKTRDIDRSGKTVFQNLLKIRGKGGPSDLSTNIDHYLYGTPKKKV